MYLAAESNVDRSIDGPTVFMETNSIGLRYFNVFGKRQGPNDGYAAVIPKGTAAMIKGDEVLINGDGETSRDFCFIENVVRINLLAVTAQAECGVNYEKSPSYRDFRAGDVRHSQADISKAKEQLGYEPAFRIYDGIGKAMPWYVRALTESDNA